MRSTSVLSALGVSVMLAACAVSPPDRPVTDSPAVEANRPMDSTSVPPTPGPPVTQTPRAYRPGPGVVQSASVVSLSSSPSAAAGGTGAAASTPTMAYRVQMPDGTTQSIVQAGERFAVGERVEITGDGRVVRP